jgi:hypothetical protein
MKINKSGSTRRRMPTNSQNPQTEQKQNKNQIKPTNPWVRRKLLQMILRLILDCPTFATHSSDSEKKKKKKKGKRYSGSRREREREGRRKEVQKHLATVFLSDFLFFPTLFFLISYIHHQAVLVLFYNGAAGE